MINATEERIRELDVRCLKKYRRRAVESTVWLRTKLRAKLIFLGAVLVKQGMENCQ